MSADDGSAVLTVTLTAGRVDDISLASVNISSTTYHYCGLELGKLTINHTSAQQF